MYTLDQLKQAARLKNTENRLDEIVEHHWSNIIPQQFIRLDPWEIEYLYNLASNAKVGIQEIGRHHGGSTTVFANANTQAPIHSIDIDPTDDDFLIEMWSKMKVGENVNLIVGDSTSYQANYNYDLLFVDGDHSYKGCLEDLNNWYDNLTIGGSVICHDAYDERVSNAILDFTSNKKVEFVLDAKIPNHLTAKFGSLCHFIKKEN